MYTNQKPKTTVIQRWYNLELSRVIKMFVMVIEC